MARKKRCPVPGCDWQGKILYGPNGHVTLKHPEFNVEAEHEQITEYPPVETPEPAAVSPPPVPTLPASEVKPPAPPVKDETKVKSFSTGKVLYIFGGLALIAVSLYTGKQWMANYNLYLLGIATALLFGSGSFLIFWAFKRKGSRYVRPSLRAGAKKYKGEANSIIVYAKPDPENKGKFKPWKIEFDYLPYPPGLKRKLRNDGKYYSFNVCKGTSYTVDEEGNVSGLEDLVLQDTAYCDPRLLKDAVEMRYSREYYTPEPSLLQKIRPVIFFAAVGIGALILIMVGNPTA